MADEGDPGRLSRAEGEGGSRPPARSLALEERIARLELEVAALRGKIDEQAVSLPAAVAAPVAEARVAAPPPPMPIPLPVAEGVDGGGGTAGQAFIEDWAKARPPAERVSDSHGSFEERLGSQVFNRVAIVSLLIGTALFLKWAINRQWIGPTGRVLAGLVAGAGLVVWSERFRRNGFAAFSYSLKALGSGVLYLSLWAAFHLYHLLPAPAALALMVAVTAWNAYMAWAQNSELLAAYALAGGFATPLLLSSGGNHEIFLFTYLLAIDVATVVLVRLRPWQRLLLGTFPVTMVFFIAWYAEYFAADGLATTSIFIALFAAVFGSVPLGRARSAATTDAGAEQATLLEDILLPLANAAFAALAFYSALQDSGHHALLPWLMVALAAVYLGVMQAPQTRTASAIHLSLAVVLLTIAIPLKASGHWITVSWLVEGLALLWVASRLAPTDGESDAGESYASRTLLWLGSGALGLGMCGVIEHSLGSSVDTTRPLFSADTATALIGVGVFAVAAWLALNAGGEAKGESRGLSGWIPVAEGGFAAVGLIAVLLALREVLTSWTFEGPADAHAPLQSADFVTALIGLAVLAGVIAISLRTAKERTGEWFWTSCAAVCAVVFNAVAVLTGVREIVALFPIRSTATYYTASDFETGLQQALAISAFMMLYGAALLAAGFWKRSGFLRWQALVLLVFTIFKTFLYDMRNLSEGYRVASFMGLGALLMAISFAYQKDWLNLREPQPEHKAGQDSEAAR